MRKKLHIAIDGSYCMFLCVCTGSEDDCVLEPYHNQCPCIPTYRIRGMGRQTSSSRVHKMYQADSRTHTEWSSVTALIQSTFIQCNMTAPCYPGRTTPHRIHTRDAQHLFEAWKVKLCLGAAAISALVME